MPITDPNWTEGSATGILPWDIPAANGGPRRGTLADYGSALIEDEDPKPPTDGSMLYGDLCNGLQQAAAAADKVHFAWAATISLDGGGNPVISQVTGPGANAVLANLALTPSGPGVTTITWAQNIFPPPILGPVATLNDATTEFGGGINATVVDNGRGVTVSTWTLTNSPAYRPFTVLFW